MAARNFYFRIGATKVGNSVVVWKNTLSLARALDLMTKNLRLYLKLGLPRYFYVMYISVYLDLFRSQWLVQFNFSYYIRTHHFQISLWFIAPSNLHINIYKISSVPWASKPEPEGSVDNKWKFGAMIWTHDFHRVSPVSGHGMQLENWQLKQREDAPLTFTSSVNEAYTYSYTPLTKFTFRYYEINIPEMNGDILDRASAPHVRFNTPIKMYNHLVLRSLNDFRISRSQFIPWQSVRVALKSNYWSLPSDGWGF